MARFSVLALFVAIFAAYAAVAAAKVSRNPVACSLIRWGTGTAEATYVVPVGTACTWNWIDAATHCLKSLSKPPYWKTIGPFTGVGAGGSVTFNKVGTYRYSDCKTTSKAKGTIIAIPKNCGKKPRCQGKCHGTDRCAFSCASYPKTNKRVRCNACCRKFNKNKKNIAACLKACNK